MRIVIKDFFLDKMLLTKAKKINLMNFFAVKYSPRNS